MMAYIHERYAARIAIADLAAAAFAGERECFRAFRDCLHTTPAAYLQSYRLPLGCTPVEYRRKWQDHAVTGQELNISSAMIARY